ncbi:unnamed protein product [Phytophthora fragariaefolia]|uniref:Unnamed protein product n=1 Tax=Phytophthora fragariaefolia TaxID=1490495 RepID=A0A9W6Y5J3_9STRA|nr:unnamed protein product [Phytophthora fragariaefolia]
MKAAVDDLAICHFAITAQRTWDMVNAEFYRDDNDEALPGLTRDQVVRRVYRARRLHFGGNVYGMIDVVSLCFVSGSAMMFFQFQHVEYHDLILQGKIAWAHSRLMGLLRYPGSAILIDGTFQSVARPFRQCLVIMLDDPSSRLSVPVMYILTTGMLAECSNKIMMLMGNTLHGRLRPARVVCAFEPALVDAVGTQFPEVRMVGCIFQFKQAIRRHMAKLHISPAAITIAMASGVLDMLTVIRPSHVDTHGSNHLIRRLQQECSTHSIGYDTAKWTRFWNYFRRTWIRRYSIDLWNVNGMDLDVVSRTANPLE